MKEEKWNNLKEFDLSPNNSYVYTDRHSFSALVVLSELLVLLVCLTFSSQIKMEMREDGMEFKM